LDELLELDDEELELVEDALLEELELLPGSDELLALDDEEVEDELLPGSDELFELDDEELELVEDELLLDEEELLLEELPQFPPGHGSHTPPVPTPGISNGAHSSPGPHAP
jgi:hypothetical protein